MNRRLKSEFAARCTASSRWHISLLAVAAILAGCAPKESPSPAVQQESDAEAVGIAPSLIQYRQVLEFPSGLADVHGVAVGPDDSIYVAGDKMVRHFAPDGKPMSDIALDSSPKCLAIGGASHRFPGRIYVGMREGVQTFDPKGARLAVWKTLGDKAIVTSLTTADDDVFVADAGNRIIWHYDPSGTLKGRIGEPDRARKIPGFVITSEYFDIVVGTDDLVYAVNPRRLRLEGYTFQGDLERFWGKGSTALEDFFGCCNPAHLAVLPDGRFVTAEKGIPRIKVYSREGKFECVVAGPQQLDVVAADIASDKQGRVLVLDPSAKSVRIFQRIAASVGATATVGGDSVGDMKSSQVGWVKVARDAGGALQTNQRSNVTIWVADHRVSDRRPTEDTVCVPHPTGFPSATDRTNQRQNQSKVASRG